MCPLVILVQCLNDKKKAMNLNKMKSFFSSYNDQILTRLASPFTTKATEQFACSVGKPLITERLLVKGGVSGVRRSALCALVVSLKNFDVVARVRRTPVSRSSASPKCFILLALESQP